MKSETPVQKSGWIVWWINTVIYFLLAVLLVGALSHVSALSNNQMDRALAIGMSIVIALMLIAIQIISFFMIKFIHKDNSYIYPIVLVVLAFFGPTLYLIPGIWGIMYANGKKLKK
ncbi:hypothetical protein [Companilactobacillus zhongbaensis]|uniref:hypothetical protein n=1 Tax=Companilactobacillus zhongbaensis TaxID=2486009 RepID=UPI000F77DD5C|nr:hypothetical protein [Companilactobacillus zhongbaensis]